MKPAALADALVAGRLAPAGFGHREHLAAAWALLRRYPFLTAAQRLAEGIERVAAAAGAPDKVNVTMTLAFLSLVDERRGAGPDDGFDAFVARHPDLLERNVLSRWYSDARLQGPRARATFLMPDRYRAAAPRAV